MMQAQPDFEGFTAEQYCKKPHEDAELGLVIEGVIASCLISDLDDYPKPMEEFKVGDTSFDSDLDCKPKEKFVR
jgi:hypothetical protein